MKQLTELHAGGLGIKNIAAKPNSGAPQKSKLGLTARFAATPCAAFNAADDDARPNLTGRCQAG